MVSSKDTMSLCWRMDSLDLASRIQWELQVQQIRAMCESWVRTQHITPKGPGHGFQGQLMRLLTIG